MVLPYEHEVRVYPCQDTSEPNDGGVTARCTCGRWSYSYPDGMTARTMWADIEAHEASHPPEPPPNGAVLDSHDVAAEMAASLAEYVGQMMIGGIDGSDLPPSVNFGSGERFGLRPDQGVIDLDDGRRVVATVTVGWTPSRDHDGS